MIMNKLLSTCYEQIIFLPSGTKYCEIYIVAFKKALCASGIKHMTKVLQLLLMEKTKASQTCWLKTGAARRGKSQRHWVWIAGKINSECPNSTNYRNHL